MAWRAPPAASSGLNNTEAPCGHASRAGPRSPRGLPHDDHDDDGDAPPAPTTTTRAAACPPSPAREEGLLSDSRAAAAAAAAAAHRRRRPAVFSEPVHLDGPWAPVVVPKSDAQRAEIARALRGNILFADLDEDVERTIVDAMAPREYPCGATIMMQGAPGDFYHVLAGGRARITVDGAPVLDAGPGSGFGELALLYDAPRAATVTVTSPGGASTWALDRGTFKRATIGAAVARRAAYGGFLRGVPLLAPLTPPELLALADVLVPLRVPPGGMVVAQGDPAADRCFIVESGELAATMAGASGEVCPRLTRGAHFGERALLRDEPRAATVTAVAPSVVLAMDRAAFVRLLGPLGELALRRAEGAYAAGAAAAGVGGNGGAAGVAAGAGAGAGKLCRGGDGAEEGTATTTTTVPGGAGAGTPEASY